MFLTLCGNIAFGIFFISLELFNHITWKHSMKHLHTQTDLLMTGLWVGFQLAPSLQIFMIDSGETTSHSGIIWVRCVVCVVILIID